MVATLAAPPVPPVPIPPVVGAVDHPVIIAADSYGCGWYRCTLPARIAGAEVREALPIHVNPFTGERLAVGGLGPINVFQRPAESSLPDTIRHVRASGREVWIELDDDIAALDGRNPMGRPWTPEKRHALTLAIRAANGVTTSTPTLGASLSKWNRNVRVIPNAVDPYDFLFDGRAIIPRFHDEVIRIGWQGSYSHLADLKMAMPALLEVGRLPNVEVHVFGYDPWQPLTGKEQRTGQLAFDGVSYYSHGWTLDLRQHYRRISGLDVALAPVIDSPFNRSKSAIKWMEHSIYATPMVVSNVRCYTETVRHGETALVAKDERDWRKYLTALVKSADLRQEIGLAAQTEVLTRHTLTQRGSLWRDVLGVTA